MPPSLEGGGEEPVQDGLGGLVVDEAAGQHDDVGIVVLADEAGDVLVPYQSSPHALVLVEGDGHALAAAADGDAGIDLAALDALCQGVGEVGIVYTLVAEGAVVLAGVAALLEIGEYKLFERIARVVAGQSDCLYFHSFQMFKSCFTC